MKPPVRSNRRVCHCVSSGCGEAILGVDECVKTAIRGRYVSEKEFIAHKRLDDNQTHLNRRRGAQNVNPSPHGQQNVTTSDTSTTLSTLPSTHDSSQPSPSQPGPSSPPSSPILQSSAPRSESGHSTEHHPQRTRSSGRQPGRTLSAFQRIQSAFETTRRHDITADGLIFVDSAPEDHSIRSLYLRSDALVNTEFIEYESHVFNVFLEIEKVSAGANSECEFDAKRKLLDIVETEWERLVDLKRNQLLSQRQARGNVKTQSGPCLDVNTEPYLTSPLANMHPVIIAAYLLVAVLHLISGLSLNDCRFVLESLSCIINLTLLSVGPLLPRSQKLVDTVPKDARHVLEVLKLSPAAKAFACCPKCYACYPENGSDSYPDKCTFKATPSSPACGRNLKRTRTIRGKVYSYPARRYLYHDLKQWLGELLCRPSMEDQLDRDIRPSTDGVMYDIWDGKRLQSLLGVDQKPFFFSRTSEGRYAFSLCMDGFNPFQMKEAGKKVSVGAIYMVCLNLPPEERHRVENMFLVGIIPGPGEPSCEEINHLLRPLIDDLVDFYASGVYYSRTPKYKIGRTVRCVLVPIVSDLPAIRQLIGFSSFNSLTFCCFCPLSLHDISNTDYESWGARTAEDFRYWSYEWRDAPSVKEREDITGAHGVRCSELLRLIYWNPVQDTTVDSMHVFFQGNLPQHCRVVWGMDIKFVDGDGSTSDPLSASLMTSTDVQKAFIALRRSPQKELEAIKFPTLKLLAQERGLRINARRKVVYINALIDYRIRQGWFNNEGELIQPPRDDELPAIISDWTATEPTTMELETAHAYYETAQDPKALHDLTKAHLIALCLSRIKNSKQQSFVSLNKADLIARLMAQRIKDGTAYKSGKLVNPDSDRFAEARRTNSLRKKTRVLGHDRLSEIWKDMEHTTLPSWLSAVPAHVGEAKSGKVTADQWRTFCTVHLVVTLVRLWGICNEAASSRESLMLNNFMDLISATKLATMRTMTKTRANLGREYMIRYLNGLRELFPGIPITANQHNSIHLYKIIDYFGPTHAWRCWVFERWNYLLQQVQTNKHFGELENTMFTRLCMNQRLRSLIQVAGVQHAFENLAAAFNRIFNSDTRGSRLNDILAFTQPSDTLGHDTSRHVDKLDEAELELLRGSRDMARAASDGASGTLRNPSRIRPLCQRHRTFAYRGVSYSPWTYNRNDSYVVVGKSVSDNLWHAARIRSIFTHIQNPYTGEHTPKTYIVIEKFRALTSVEEKHDPYRIFPIAGGRLYHTQVAGDLELVTPEEILCHFAHTPFSSQVLPDCIHALPIDRV